MAAHALEGMARREQNYDTAMVVTPSVERHVGVWTPRRHYLLVYTLARDWLLGQDLEQRECIQAPCEVDCCLVV